MYSRIPETKDKPKLTSYPDAQGPQTDESILSRKITLGAFGKQYRDVKDELPNNIPKPGGRDKIMAEYVHASHVANKVTQRPHTGLFIFINRTLINHIV